MKNKTVQLLLFTIFCSFYAFAQMEKVSGVVHPFTDWAEWKPLGLDVSYANLGYAEGKTQLWFGANFRGTDSMIRLQGKDLFSMPRVAPQFDTSLVKGYDRDLDGLKHPILSRPSGIVLQDGTEMVYGSIGPRYRGGASELYPVLFIKKKGGEWAYAGPPTGDPAAFLQEARKAGATVRCEGGGLVQLADGRLRLYAHGMLDPVQVEAAVKGGRVASSRILIAEADSVDGPWRFLRDKVGNVVDVTEGSGIPWLFPQVQALGEDGFLLTGADQWPPNRIYGAYSADGVQFRLPVDGGGRAVPLMAKTDVRPDARFCKILRGVWDPEQKRLVFISNISRPGDQGRSMLYGGSAAVDRQKLAKLISGVNSENSTSKEENKSRNHD
jgi:hypothetical protein